MGFKTLRSLPWATRTTSDCCACLSTTRMSPSWWCPPSLKRFWAYRTSAESDVRAPAVTSPRTHWPRSALPMSASTLQCAWKMGWQGIEFNKNDFYVWKDLHSRDDSSPTHGLETSWVGFTSATGEAFEDHDILSWDFCEFEMGEEIINSTRCHPRGCEDASCFWMSPPVREGLAVNDDVGCPTGTWQGDCREDEGEICLWKGHFECRE